MISYHERHQASQQNREENKLLQDQEKDAGVPRRWSWERFLSGGSLRHPPLRSREIKAPKNRISRRQLVDEAFESQRMQAYQAIVERNQASLNTQAEADLADISLNCDQHPPRRQAALAQLLKRGAFGRLRQILALGSSKRLPDDSNLRAAFFNLHKGGAFSEEEVIKRAPDLARLSFDIDVSNKNSPRILLRPSSGEDLMKSLGNASLKNSLEFDLSTWRIALGLEPQGGAKDLPSAAENNLLTLELRRAMLGKIKQIVPDKDLRYNLTSAHIELFEEVLENESSFTLEV